MVGKRKNLPLSEATRWESEERCGAAVMSIGKLERDVRSLSKRPKVNFVFSVSDIAGSTAQLTKPKSSSRRTIG